MSKCKQNNDRNKLVKTNLIDMCTSKEIYLILDQTPWHPVHWQQCFCAIRSVDGNDFGQLVDHIWSSASEQA